MTTVERVRTWQAVITFRTPTGVEEVEADPGPYSKTMRDTAKAARDEAAEYLRSGLAVEAHISLTYTTKAHGTQRNFRSGGFLWVEDAAVYVDRCGC
jgi:hypothetical protein